MNPEPLRDTEERVEECEGPQLADAWQSAERDGWTVAEVTRMPAEFRYRLRCVRARQPAES